MDVFGLEFGCADRPRRPKFLGVDIRSLPNIKYVCNAWDIDKFVEDGVVDEIFSRHFFEHLTYQQADLTLKSWYKILKIGGKMEMIVPDMEFHIKQWLDPNRKTTINRNGFSNEQWAKVGFWGHQNGELTDTWDVHKSGYDFPLLNNSLSYYGFKNIKRLNDKAYNLSIEAYK